MKKALCLALALGLPVSAGAAPVAIPRAPQPLKLVLAGPPGAGKGTMAALLVRDYGLVHVSVGDLLRERAKADPALRESVRRGELVSASLVASLVRERLSRPDAAERGFILDGFPRELSQAESFKELLSAGRVAIDAVVALDAPEDVLRRRVLGRGREDDTAETFANRMKIYREHTRPAVEALGTHAPMLPVEASGSVEANYAALRSALDGALSARSGR